MGAARAATCGTSSGYKRHLNRLEVPCDECNTANTRWRRTQRTDATLAPYRRADLAMAIYADDRRRGALVAAAFRGEL